MRGTLVILAALCVVVAAEASSVKFVSVDEGQNGKDKKNRSEVSDGTDPGMKKRVEEMVKKISDGNDQSQKTVKSSDAERSSEGSDSVGESVKKAASSEKPKVEKRDVRRALDMMSKRAKKRASAEEADAWNIFNARKIIVKYLSLQKTVVSKITTSLIYAVDRLETDQREKESLITALKKFRSDLEQAYDNVINSLGSHFRVSDMPPNPQRKFTRADDLPIVMKNLNQRNPLALIPLVGRLINAIAGAATIVDVASNLSEGRSNAPDFASLVETLDRFLPPGSFPTMPWDPQVPDY